jgi:NAD(P)-dependent dehydrogenase (short-subunit alcohol dehydrogenase family)
MSGVLEPDSVADAFAAADELGPLRILVHCAGGGTAVRVLHDDGTPASRDAFANIVNLNLVGTFDVLRNAATRMARHQPIDGDRGVCVLTSSIAAYEGQAAQVAYASAKAGIVGMTLAAARDLSRFGIRVATIVPGLFDTPMLEGLSPETRAAMNAAVPHPARLGSADEFARTALHIIDNGILNGECIRLDGALRLSGVETMWGNQLVR